MSASESVGQSETSPASAQKFSPSAPARRIHMRHRHIAREPVVEDILGSAQHFINNIAGLSVGIHSILVFPCAELRTPTRRQNRFGFVHADKPIELVIDRALCLDDHAVDHIKVVM